MTGIIVALLLLFAVITVAWLVAAKMGLIKPEGAATDAGAGDEKAPVPFKLRPRLLSAAEASFHSVLRQAIPMLIEAGWRDGQPLVFAKVRLADLLQVDGKAAGSGRQSALNRIDRKHVDFVLCDPATTRPLLLVELDDASHERSDRKARDKYVDRAAAAAGVPVLHVKAAAGYSPRGLAVELERALGVGGGKGDAMASSAAPA